MSIIVSPKSSCKLSSLVSWLAHHEPLWLNSCAFSGSWDGLLLEADEETTGRMSFPIPCNSEQAVKYRALFKTLAKLGIQVNKKPTNVCYLLVGSKRFLSISSPRPFFFGLYQRTQTLTSTRRLERPRFPYFRSFYRNADWLSNETKHSARTQKIGTGPCSRSWYWPSNRKAGSRDEIGFFWDSNVRHLHDRLLAIWIVSTDVNLHAMQLMIVGT